MNLQLKPMDILLFITTLGKSDRYIETIYLNGGCYQFHLIIKTFFSDCVAYINKDKDHVITLYKGNYYDITGIVDGADYYPLMSRDDINIVSNWSFYRNKAIMIKECPFCEEPITF